MKSKILERIAQNTPPKEPNKMLIEMDIETAKSVREILFESQIGYTYDESITPIRLSNKISLIDLRHARNISAKSVREILFESQIGYTYDESITPIRILKIRNVIDDIDSKME